jgi:small subunit ribosomal protein S7
MGRRAGVTPVRDIGVDARYGSEQIQKLINIVMWRGKKNVARTIVYEALDVLKKKTGGSPDKALQLFGKALENATPEVEVRPRRVGGSVYQIPAKVEPRRARSLAMRSLVKAAAARRDKRMGLKLAHELLDAAEGRGGAVKEKIDRHKMAEANRAFSHYGW